ncbi:hypothetical protein HQ529_04605 [Candidatus Woesearchaeota archaeon]|nr:hypothetical protein [Candidatus Woesearchaeota archaeon]
MKISFFEEFPEKENFDKLKLLDFNTNLYVAAKSVSEFKHLRDKIKNNYENVEEVIYWPVLDRDEGYWMSPFSKQEGLERVVGELNNEEEKLRVLWDAELPMLDKKLFFTESYKFFQNKKLIKKFLTNIKHDIEIAENTYETGITKTIYGFLGVSFDSKKISHKKIIMLYTSFIPNQSVSDYFLNHLKYNLRYDKDLKVSLGVISTGIQGTEQILPPERLEHDLRLTESEKIKEVVIFRLGGLNKEYVDVVKRFV